MHNVPDYHLLTERIGWRITDFDWDAIDLDKVSDDDRLRIRETTLTESEFIKKLLAEISADEMRHHQWFANALQRYLPLSKDPDRYRQEICDAITNFHMPQFFYQLEFPYIDGRLNEYLTAEDIAMIK